MKQASDEQELKTRARRRLIGAGVLAVIAAAVLPLVLDREPPPVSRDLEVKLPAQDGGFTSRIVPVTPQAGNSAGRESAVRSADAPAAADAKPAKPAPAAGKAVETTASKTDKPAGKPADKPVEKPADKPVEKAAARQAEKSVPNPAPPAKQAATGENYVVQLAALTNEANVRQLRDKLSGAGIKSYTEKVKTASGESTRVRVGPFNSREAAQRMQERLKGLGVTGAVVPE